MIEAISTAGPTPPNDSNLAAAANTSKGATSPSIAASPSVQAATRVYVDRSASGVYVYRLVDVSTGRVLAELPRTGSEALQVSVDYAPGAMASQTA